MGFDFTNITGFTNITKFVDSWSAYLADSRKSGETLGRASDNIRSLFIERATTSSNTDTAKERRRVSELADGLTREMFATLYNGGEIKELDAPAPDSEWVQEAHRAASEIGEFDALCKQVSGDPDMAAIATSKMLQAIAEALPHEIKREKQAEKERKKRIAAEQLGIPMKSSSKKDDGPSSEDMIRAVMRRAARKGAEEVNDVRAAMAGISPGMEACPARFDQEDTRRMDLAAKLMNDQRLRQIMKLAGRMRRMADSNRRVRDPQGRTEVVGVTTGNDIVRALPTELSLMKNKTLRRSQLIKFAESKMAQYKMEGVEPMGKGPIVVMLDTSGSMMSGDRIMWAAACTLACMGTAIKEKRTFTVIGFNEQVTFTYRVDSDGTAWDCLDSGWSQINDGPREVALRIASMQVGGGTSFGHVFERGLTICSSEVSKRADLVLITDGHAKLPNNDLIERLNAAKGDGLRVFGLTVGGGHLSHAVSQLCDRTVNDIEIVSDEEVASALP